MRLPRMMFRFVEAVLFVSTSNPAHPFHKFNVGNRQTLDVGHRATLQAWRQIGIAIMMIGIRIVVGDDSISKIGINRH